MRLAAAVWAIAAAASASDDGGVAVLSAPQLTAKLQRAKSPHELVLLHASHSDAFDVAAARVAVAPTLRVTEMDGFLRLGLAPRRVLVLDINIKMRGADDAGPSAGGFANHRG